MSKQKKSKVRHLSEQEVYNYFFPRPAPLWTGIAIVLGIILIIVGMILQFYMSIIVSLAIACAGIYGIHRWVKSHPDDACYDAWIESQARELYSRAIQTLDLHPQKNDTFYRIRSYVLPGSLASEDYIADDVWMKQGKNGRWHFSVNVYTYIFATAKSLAIFKSDVNAFSPLIHIDQHEMYAYRHIVGVASKQLPDTVIFGETEHPCRTEQFCLKIMNGETIPLSAAVKVGRLGSVAGTPILTITNASYDRILNELRQILVSKR